VSRSRPLKQRFLGVWDLGQTKIWESQIEFSPDLLWRWELDVCRPKQRTLLLAGFALFWTTRIEFSPNLMFGAGPMRVSQKTPKPPKTARGCFGRHASSSHRQHQSWRELDACLSNLGLPRFPDPKTSGFRVWTLTWSQFCWEQQWWSWPVVPADPYLKKGDLSQVSLKKNFKAKRSLFVQKAPKSALF